VQPVKLGQVSVLKKTVHFIQSDMELGLSSAHKDDGLIVQPLRPHLHPCPLVKKYGHTVT